MNLYPCSFFSTFDERPLMPHHDFVPLMRLDPLDLTFLTSYWWEAGAVEQH
jgi:hypothetical protein